ncbi:M36 family metallopeptidase [Tahibacter amnicola]|uniref:M36 family metallopeptidase n=1 Tax=Tahibacter amnicola TaxID=2976241 RepID=A0ABY6BDR2_9GAMM|nr:M36 family metallopeptidase [Tahibacter amnicola]UXI67726.1 M36 family metallopeptidase [Tahibacter amnicola]
MAPALQRRLTWLDPAANAAAAPASGTAARKAAPSAGLAKVHRRPQEIAGIEVVDATTSILVDARHQQRAVFASLGAGPVTTGLPAFVLDSEAAAQKALDAVAPGSQARVGGRVATTAPRYARFTLADTPTFQALRPLRIKPVWFPTSTGLEPAYYAEVTGVGRSQQRPLAAGVIVSAQDGRVLRKRNLIHDAVAFQYRVLADESGTPYHDPYGFVNPHPTGVPDAWAPATPAPMRLLTRPVGAPADPWLPDSATQTVGNNVDAFFNADAPGADCGSGWGPAFNAAEGDFRASVSSAGVFDYTYNVANARTDYFQCLNPDAPIPTSSAQLNAKIVQSFYTANWLHDLLYRAGYDEASGNAQMDNYGRGGIGGDPLLVHVAQLGTFAYGPEDGESASLTLGVNTSSTSNRDVSGFDFPVFAHEWMHTVFARLADMDHAGQQSALNEGTADFLGFFLTVREQDRFATPRTPAFGGAYAVGAYMNRDYDFRADMLPAAGSPGHPDNTYYHGIRRFPTTIDLRKNPLTFKHISLDHPLPAEWQAFDWKARSRQNAEVHSAGEIWTASLWQCARNILAAAPSAQFQSTRDRFLHQLVQGLKLMPPDATFTEARTALLLTIRADSETDYALCRNGFAARGMGAGAVSPARYSDALRGVRESFRISDAALSLIAITLREIGGDGDGVLDQGESGELVITLQNSGYVPLANITVTAPNVPGIYNYPSGSTRTGVALQPAEDMDIVFPVRLLTNLGPIPLPFPVVAADQTQRDAVTATIATTLVNSDIRTDAHADRLSASQTFAADWQADYTGNHGCVQFLCLGRETPDYAEIFPWRRLVHRGEMAYYLGDSDMTLESTLATRPFPVSAGANLQLTLRHDYDFARVGAGPGRAVIEIQRDGGEWEAAAPYVTSGQAQFSGVSNGWQTTTLRFTESLGGRTVRLRLSVVSDSGRATDAAHWAISQVQITGAAAPMFSTLRADTP